MDWEWYSDINTSRLFLHILLKANWEDKKWKGMSILRGQLVTSHENLKNETGLTISEIRTSIRHLQMTGELTSKGTNKNTVFTVVNYDKYQSVSKQNSNEITINSQSIDNLLTTTKEVKELKNIKNKDIGVRFAPPTIDDVNAYCNEKGVAVDPERFIDFYESKGWMIGKNKMKDWKAAVRNWSRQGNNAKGDKNQNGDIRAKTESSGEGLTSQAIRAGAGKEFEGF